MYIDTTHRYKHATRLEALADIGGAKGPQARPLTEVILTHRFEIHIKGLCVGTFYFFAPLLFNFFLLNPLVSRGI